MYEDDLNPEEGAVVSVVSSGGISGGGTVVVGGGSGVTTVTGGNGIQLSCSDNEKKVRREIANSNERRRMQSINAGFQSLRTLLPHHEGEKLSKAAILQQTAEYIYSLEQEKTRLLAQNCQLKRLLSLSQQRLEGINNPDSPNIKRKRISTETIIPGEVTEIEETIENVVVDTSNIQTLQERQLRQRLEEKLQNLEMEQGGTTVSLPTNPSSNKPPNVVTVLEESIKGSSSSPPTAVIVEDRLSALTPAPASETYILSSQTPSKISTAANESRIPIITTTTTTNKDPPMRVEVESISRIIEQPQIIHHKPVTATTIATTASTTKPAGINASIKDPGQIVTTDPQGQRSYVVTMNNSTTRQNLDSIVEAIRHLEGDHLFSSEDIVPHQVVKEEVVEYNISTEDSDKSSSTVPATTTTTFRPISELQPVQVSGSGGPGGNIIILKPSPQQK